MQEYLAQLLIYQHYRLYFRGLLLFNHKIGVRSAAVVRLTVLICTLRQQQSVVADLLTWY